MKKFPPLSPVPPLPPVEAFLPFPGEPDKAAEVRLRANLRLFRYIATLHERTKTLVERPVPKAFRELLYPRPPELPPELEKRMEEISKEIWKPEAVAERREVIAPLIEKEPEIKEILLAIERTFIERGWHLPKWKRPSWLLE